MAESLPTSYKSSGTSEDIAFVEVVTAEFLIRAFSELKKAQGGASVIEVWNTVKLCFSRCQLCDYLEGHRVQHIPAGLIISTPNGATGSCGGTAALLRPTH